MSGNQYSRDLMKVGVAKMLQTIGWNSINSTPLEILTDILVQYLSEIAKSTNDYANEFGCTEPNLDHLGLAFRDCHVNLSELVEYITYVDFAHGPTPVPKYPIAREDNLNFLKPGSKECVTRPVHIHEHLPPMYLLQEPTESETEKVVKKEEQEDFVNVESENIFKKPAEISPSDSFKRSRVNMEEEGRPTREISSVMMTTSGYISPAREGRLPDSRTPVHILDPPPPTSNNSNNTATISGPVPRIPHHAAASNGGNATASSTTGTVAAGPIVKSKTKSPRKLANKRKELFKPDEKVRKSSTMKDVLKLKHSRNVNSQLAGHNGGLQPPGGSGIAVTTPQPVGKEATKATATGSNPASTGKGTKINKTLAAARLKTKNLNTTITPIPLKQNQPDNVDKLFSEPDKKKVNILKKISNVRNEKSSNSPQHVTPPDSKLLTPPLRENGGDISPVGIAHNQTVMEDNSDVVRDNSSSTKPSPGGVSLLGDVTIELVDVKQQQQQQGASVSPGAYRRSEGMYYDESPPGTPPVNAGNGARPAVDLSMNSSPQPVQMVPIVKEKRKRKDKSRVKKVPKMDNGSPQRHWMDIDNRPKTPDISQSITKLPPVTPNIPYPIFAPFPGPGLIPTPFQNPLFPNLPLNLPGFGQHPSYKNPLPAAMNFLPHPAHLHHPGNKHNNHHHHSHHNSDTYDDYSMAVSPPPAHQHHVPEPSHSSLAATVTPPVKSSAKQHSASSSNAADSTNYKDSTVSSTEKLVTTTVTMSSPAGSVASSTGAVPVAVQSSGGSSVPPPVKGDKKTKEHKKEKKDKVKKNKKKDKLKIKAEKKKLKDELKKDKDKVKKEKKDKKKDKELRNELEVSVPKLTLKLGTPSPRPDTPDTKKLNIKPVVKKEDHTEERETKRESSPELARILPLVTGQPKPKTVPPPPKEEPVKDKPTPPISSSVPSTPSVTTPARPAPALTTTAAITPGTPKSGNAGPGRPRIHPVKTKQSPVTAAVKATAAATTKKGHTPLPPNTSSSQDVGKQKVRRQQDSDSQGNEVWICPHCGKQDDGSPMIGCDDCDAWYHWVCVNIQVPPEENEDWYCKNCIKKKLPANMQPEKKKKRKKKEKKDH